MSVTCGTCGLPVAAGAAFCLSCGRPGLLACVSCGTPLSIADPFCRRCGCAVLAPGGAGHGAQQGARPAGNAPMPPVYGAVGPRPIAYPRRSRRPVAFALLGIAAVVVLVGGVLGIYI